MATFKVTYSWEDKTRSTYVNDVTNENVAVMVADAENPDIPRSAHVEITFICE